MKFSEEPDVQSVVFQDDSQIRLVFVGKSALCQTGSAVNEDSHKDVGV